MAFSPPAMTIPKWILYRIAVGIAVVGGENSIQRPGADCCRLALRETHPWYVVVGVCSCNGVIFVN